MLVETTTEVTSISPSPQQSRCTVATRSQDCFAPDSQFRVALTISFDHLRVAQIGGSGIAWSAAVGLPPG